MPLKRINIFRKFWESISVKNIWKQREKNGMNIVDMFLTGKRNHIFINTKLQSFNIPTVDGNDWMAYEDE